MKEDELIWLLKTVPQFTLMFFGAALYIFLLFDELNVGFWVIIWLIVVLSGLAIIRFGHYISDVMKRYNNWSDKIIEKHSREG